MPTPITFGAISARAFGFLGKLKAITDPYFKYVTMLLPGNGTNGAQNNTFLDSSTNNFTITRNGNTTQGTFTPYGANWSNYFGGYLTIASNTNLDLTGDYTVECWYLQNISNPGYGLIFGTTLGSVGTNEVSFFIDYPGTGFNWGSLTSGVTPVAGTWYHLAATKSGSTTRFFVNGALVASSTTAYTPPSGVNWYIGSRPSGSSGGVYAINGYVSNCRIIKGTAIYTSAFTPPTAPLTAVSGTQLLTCQSNRFVDNSSNNFAITVTNSPSVQRFSPFNPTTPYAAGTIGGSGYWDGTGDYLTVADNIALDMESSDFTIEGWIFPVVSSGGSVGIFSKRASGAVVGGVLLYYNGAGLTPSLLIGSGGSWVINQASSIAFTLGQWNHFAVVRNGTSFVLYINGVAGVSATSSSSVTDNSAAFALGAWAADGTGAISASYFSNFRVVKGTAVYTSAFTPPTAPLTAITNTSLLLNFTNAGIIDNAMMNDLETVGNAQISTSVSKFGGGSIAFDGTGDYLTTYGTPQFAFGAGDFTIECWVYFNSLTQYDCIIDFRPSGTNGAYPCIFVDTSNTLVYYVGGANRITSSAVSTGQWYHLAVSRTGTSTKMFLNGVQTGSTYTDSNSYLVGNPLTIGGLGYNSPGTYALDGYIDDLRITKGYARYTANFTPPTEAFPLQ